MTTALALHVCPVCKKRHPENWVHEGQCPRCRRGPKVKRMQWCAECIEELEAAMTGRKLVRRTWPFQAVIGIAPELQGGIVRECFVESRSRPGHMYRMVLTASGWQHGDIGCTAWQFRAVCAHVKDLNMTTTDIVVAQGSVLALIDEMEDQEIIAAISGDVKRSWVYEFRVSGQVVRGIGAEGVEQAARELAKKGEAIREIDVKIEYEDEKEARFIAQAGRFAISGDGREQLLDVAIRAKRQSKLMPNGNANPFWYEQGVTKSVRNAKNALLPETAKAYIMAEAFKADRVRQIERPSNVDDDGVVNDEPRANTAAKPAQAQQSSQPRSAPSPPAQTPPAPAQPAQSAGGGFYAQTEAMGYSREDVEKAALVKFNEAPAKLTVDQRRELFASLKAAKEAPEQASAPADDLDI